MSYGQAVDKLGSRQSRRIDRNTYLRREDDGSVTVRYHATDIIRFYPDGSATYNTGGWFTYSTKERMNEYGPAKLYSEGGMWLVSHKSDPLTPPRVTKCRTCKGTGTIHYPASYTWWDMDTNERLTEPRETYPARDERCYRCKGTKEYDYGSKPNPTRYFDGMRVTPDGRVIRDGKKLPRQHDTTAKDRKDARTMKAIKKYVALYTDARLTELYEMASTEGTAGDCLYCQIGGAMGGTDHLISHMDEGYTMATLARNAIEAKGYQNPVFIMVNAGDLAREAIRRYMVNALIPDRAGSHPARAA